jgi:5-methyltetrahydrofolate--homocysteine methyltransferase
MHPLFAFTHSRVVLFDGCIGAELIRQGLRADECPELWNLAHPEALAALHRDYFAAGCDVVQANTFGANPLKLRSYGLEDRAAELITAGVRLVRKEMPEGRFCAGDVGPTGVFRRPGDRDTVRDYEAAYETQAGLLAEAGADLILIETMYDLEELLAAVHGARNTGLPVIACMTFNRTRRGFFTLMGVSPAAMVAALEAEHVDALGANCTLSPGPMAELAQEMRGLTELPILVQPNAGQPRLEEGRAVYDLSPDDFAAGTAALADAGARMVGGCCGAGPAYVRALAARLAERHAG